MAQKKSGVSGAIDKHTGRESSSAVLFTPCGGLCECRLTSVRKVRVGWMEQRDSSFTVTENFGVGFKLVETQTPPNNRLERLPNSRSILQCPKTKTPEKFLPHT